MKNLKSLFTITLCVIIALMSVFAVGAASLDTTTKGYFSVNCNKPGYTFTVYKVADLVSTSTSPYETRYDSLIPDVSDEILSGDTEAILAALDGVETIPATATVVGTYNSDDSATANFTNLEQGIYYIKATNYPAGVKAVTNSVVALPYYTGSEWKYTIDDIELAAKVVDGTVTTEKTITNSTKNNVNYTDVSLGDTVEFEIRSTTAGSSSMKLGSYTVFDDMSAGLTLDKNSFNVALLKADGTKITDLDKNEFYTTVTSEGDGENTVFEVDLTSEYLQTEEFYGTDVYYTSVTYSATLNKHAVVGIEGNPNTEVKLEYSNKNGVTSEVEGNTVYVYTYAIKTNKYNEKGDPLAGAEFVMFKTEADAETLTNEIAKGVSDENGLVLYYTTNGEEITLQSGTYYLVETKAPTGYGVYGDTIELTITAEYGNTLVDGTYVTNCSAENGYVSCDVRNTTLVLPKTGGAGTVMFYVSGGVCLMVCAVFFVIYTRKRKATATN